jgi:tRNA(Glu) U13 pseudouridine synthase TruD
MNWNETLIRASSVGYLMTEPVTKADKEAGVLSKTAQKHLIEVYIAEKYGRKRDIQTKQMKKGIEAEQDSIDLLSMYLKLPFSKNEERFKNDFITGLPDIINGDTIIDIKSSYDLWTFLGNIPDKLDNLYYWQMQSYMWLTGTKNAIIAYCLVNTPESIIQQEKYYLLKKMDVISEESPEFIKEAMKVEFNMTFDDISINERILTFNVIRSEDDILRIENKVLKARTFLQELEQTHLNFNK